MASATTRHCEKILAASDDGLVRVEAYAKLYLHGLEQEQGCLAAAMAAELGTLPRAHPRRRRGLLSAPYRLAAPNSD